MQRAGQTPHGARPNREGAYAKRKLQRVRAGSARHNLRVGRLSCAVMRSPEEWPSRGSNPADRIRLTGPAAFIFSLLLFHNMAEKKIQKNFPPPILDSSRVLQYACIDSDVEFSGQSLLFVNGKELGAVPCLAICEEKQSGGVLLVHCAINWEVLGCSAHESVEAAQVRAEGIYRGISTRWVNGRSRSKQSKGRPANNRDYPH
jgi:hypothetical protein